MAFEYMWLYNNVEFEKASMGTKKSKLISEITDTEFRDKVEKAAIEKNLTIPAIEELVEKESKKNQEKKQTEKKVKTIQYSVNQESGSCVIECESSEDAEYIAEALFHFENQIKLYALRLKERG